MIQDFLFSVIGNPKGIDLGALTVIKQIYVDGTIVPEASTYTFSSIPDTYENLVIEGYGRLSDTGSSFNVAMQANGDSAAHYNASVPLIQTTGTTIAANFGGSDGTSAVVGNLPAASAAAGASGNFRIVIPGYARTVLNKTWHGGGFLGGSTFYWLSVAGEWLSTAAITSLSFTDANGGNFIAGSVFTLYGESG